MSFSITINLPSCRVSKQIVVHHLLSPFLNQLLVYIFLLRRRTIIERLTKCPIFICFLSLISAQRQLKNDRIICRYCLNLKLIIFFRVFKVFLKNNLFDGTSIQPTTNPWRLFCNLLPNSINRHIHTHIFSLCVSLFLSQSLSIL